MSPDKHRLFQVGIKAVIIRNDKILLLEVNSANMKGNTHGTYWDIPGGRMEQGEKPLETLKRELLEETGIGEYINAQFFHASVSNISIPTDQGELGLVLFIFKVEVGEGTKIVVSSEHTKYDWFSYTEAAKLLSVKYPSDFTEKIGELNRGE